MSNFVPGAFGPKPAFKLLKTWRDERADGGKSALKIRYSAGFWFGPLEPGEQGEYRAVVTEDRAINGRWLNTSPAVSYYSQLPKAPNDCGLAADGTPER